MNETILRGFCQKCKNPIILLDYITHVYRHKSKSDRFCDGTPVWFLSAKQMRIIEYSTNFEKWCKDKKMSSDAWGLIISLRDILEGEPILVAKILKEAKQ